MDIRKLTASFIIDLCRFLGADTLLLRAANALADALTAEPTIGGPMPEPWPGMGVETTMSVGITARYIAIPCRVDGVWHFPNSAAPSVEIVQSIRENEITAIYDGRRRIWQRNP